MGQISKSSGSASSIRISKLLIQIGSQKDSRYLLGQFSSMMTSSKLLTKKKKKYCKDVA